MKTTLHTYDYNTNDLKGFDLAQLFAQLLNTPGRGRKMHAMKMQTDFDPQAGEIELEPEHLFQNQWNSSAGRVFDWYEEAIFVNGREVRNIKRGHYLDITPEMVAIRNETLKCGYTGQQFPLSAFSNGTKRFNTTTQALGSPYLKESDLHLCRLLPVSKEWTEKREELTEAEREYLLPLYIAAQTKTAGKEREKQIAEIHATFERDSKLALTERDGKLWLLSNGVPLENCIFYNHTGEFSFGWRSKFTGAAREALLAALSNFPFKYDVQ